MCLVPVHRHKEHCSPESEQQHGSYLGKVVEVAEGEGERNGVIQLYERLLLWLLGGGIMPVTSHAKRKKLAALLGVWKLVGQTSE
eukprot:1147927-Pelagomonas_calceolata.AAC.9